MGPRPGHLHLGVAVPSNLSRKLDPQKQAAFIKAYEELLDETTTDAEQDALEEQNEGRYAKITGLKKTQLDAKRRDKRHSRHQPK